MTLMQVLYAEVSWFWISLCIQKFYNLAPLGHYVSELGLIFTLWAICVTKVLFYIAIILAAINLTTFEEI